MRSKCTIRGQGQGARVKGKNSRPKTHDSRLYKPELIAPAGDWASLCSAVEAGADGVYFGVKGLNMRNTATNFDIQELNKVMRLLKDSGKKGNLVLNVIVFDKEMPLVKKIIDSAKKAGTDAVICWDMAVLNLAKEAGLRVHLSTQASVSNFEALKDYAGRGVKRVVLARECTLDDIKSITGKIRRNKLDCEVETFIHGAMCVSISGRCFLSQHSFGKSANRGECLQPCRREFRIESMDKDAEYVIGNDYILSPKDLCSINFIDRLISAGVNAFKIEGRMRSPDYIKIVTSVYRTAIDSYFKKKLDTGLKVKLMGDLKKAYNRGFSDGFFMGEPDEWITGKLESEYEKVYLGEVTKFFKKINVVEIHLRTGGITIGEELLIYGKTTPASFVKIDELEIEHKSVKKASKGVKVAVKVPFLARANDKVFIWKKRG